MTFLANKKTLWFDIFFRKANYHIILSYPFDFRFPVQSTSSLISIIDNIQILENFCNVSRLPLLSWGWAGTARISETDCPATWIFTFATWNFIFANWKFTVTLHVKVIGPQATLDLNYPSPNSITVLHPSSLSSRTWGRLASVERISASDCRGTWDLFWDIFLGFFLGIFSGIFFWDSFLGLEKLSPFPLGGQSMQKLWFLFLCSDSSKTNICHILVGGVKCQHIFTVCQSFKELSQYIVAILWKIDKR